MSLSPALPRNPPSEAGDDPDDTPDATESAATRVSAAQLSLERYYQQSNPGTQKKDPARPPGDGVVAGASAKGKPRLLLMGQRR